MGKLLSVPEAADREAIFAKRLPYVKLGRLVRIEEADLVAFLEANRREASAGR